MRHYYLNHLLLLIASHTCASFIVNVSIRNNLHSKLSTSTSASTTESKTNEETETKISFIDTELRKAAMKLHTKKQAPKEGEAKEVEKKEPYITTHADYLQFLVDSQHVYSTFEEIISNSSSNDDKENEANHSELEQLQNTGLERTEKLEKDIQYMTQEYNLQRPSIGKWGIEYSQLLNNNNDGNLPSFICHYYNHYFAHTAGGRMIGKQMSSLLLNKKTLEFYKWDDDINEIKVNVKDTLENIISKFTIKEKEECINATADTFRYGGGLMSYLRGGK